MAKKFFILMLISVGFYSSMAQTNEQNLAGLKQRYPVLMSTYAENLEKLDVEYIVAIDLSESMNRNPEPGAKSYFEQVKDGLTLFINAIPNGCKLSITGFGAGVIQVQLPTEVNDQSRSSIIGALNSLKAGQGFTDLKGAVKQGIENCSSKSTIKYLFFFTDFNHDPSANSPYNKLTWDQLGQNFQTLTKDMMVDVFALKLPLAANAGRDLNEVRKVFPEMNVIDFDSQSLGNWFADRSSKMMEQNLWAFVSRDLKKVQTQLLPSIKMKVCMNSRLIASGMIKGEIPPYIKGIQINEVSIKNLPENRTFIFIKDSLTFAKNRCITGKIKSTSGITPCFVCPDLNVELNGSLISPAIDEIEQLHALVSLSKYNKNAPSANQLLSYNYKTTAAGGWMINWPVWVFMGVVALILLTLVLLIINTAFRKKLKRYTLRINDGDPLNLGKRKVFIISSHKSNCDFKIEHNEKLSVHIFLSRPGPFMLLIKPRLLIKPVSEKPIVTIDDVMQTKRTKYYVPVLKNIIVNEKLASLKLFFFASERKHKIRKHK